jgi:hypothetical protein
MAIFIGNLVVLCRETRGIKLGRKPKLTNHQRREALVRRRTDLKKLVREGRELPVHYCLATRSGARNLGPDRPPATKLCYARSICRAQ